MSMAESQRRSDRLVLMGVAGCGKTTVGQALSAATGIRFLDGDDLHPEENVAKMSHGLPLTDHDRWPWLARIGQTLAAEAPLIIGCSALKRRYRDYIWAKAQAPVLLIHLAGPRDLIAQRMIDRKGHFMPLSLLDSQFAALEPPAADEDSLTVSIDQPLPGIVADIRAALARA
jgi:gluconokinase